MVSQLVVNYIKPMTNDNEFCCGRGCCGDDMYFDDIVDDVVEIGEVIPDFELQAYHEDKEIDVRLSDYRGKWLILFFYPKDFTFVCPTELEEMQNYYDKFKELGAEVLSVSTDTVEVHKAWHDVSDAIGKVTYPMLADPTGELSKTFGTYIYDEGVSLRGTFIIDPEGVLKSVEINHNDIGRSAAELYRKMQAAKYISEHAGHVCPASWKPGDDDLTPGLDLVGKI
jgi:peroxiredoxin